MTVLNFNNLIKVFQDSQDELKKIIATKRLNVSDVSDTNPDTEKIIIETYDESGDNEKLSDTSSEKEEFPNEMLNQTNETDDQSENVVEILKEDIKPFSVVDEDEITYFEIQEIAETKFETEVPWKKYTCDMCGDVFLIKTGFSHHMMQKHSICVPTENYDKYSSDVKIKLPDDCASKAFKFAPKHSQSKKTHRFQCQICKQGFEDGKDLKFHYKIHKTFKCDKCNAAFIKSSYLKDHMSMHSTEKKHVCDICDKAFKYRNGLAVHKIVHSNDRAHICESCGRGFNARTTLVTHMRLKHSINERSFACPECDSVFKIKSWLDKHMSRRHTSNRTKDFVCSICGISYLNKTTLTRHMNNKHFDKERRFFCNICEKSYTMNNKLVKHMQTKHNLLNT